MFWDKTNRCIEDVHVIATSYCGNWTAVSDCTARLQDVIINTLQELEWVIVILCAFQIAAHKDPFLRSMAHWVLEDYSKALDTLLEQPTNNSFESTESKCEVFMM